MKKALAGLLLLLGTSGPPSATWAGGIDLALSNETANFAVLLNTQRLTRGGGSQLSVGGFLSEDDDRLLHASLMARGTRLLQRSQYTLAAGVKAIGGEVAISEERQLKGSDDSEKVGAVGLGFEAGLLLAASRHNPIELGVEAFFAPSITSFSDAEQFSELAARLQVEVIPSARAYLGYRRLSFDTNDYDGLRIDRNLHIGIEIDY